MLNVLDGFIFIALAYAAVMALSGLSNKLVVDRGIKFQAGAALLGAIWGLVRLAQLTMK